MVSDPATFGTRFRWLKTASINLGAAIHNNNKKLHALLSRPLDKALFEHPSELCSNIERVTWEHCGQAVAGRFYGEL